MKQPVQNKRSWKQKKNAWLKLVRGLNPAQIGGERGARSRGKGEKANRGGNGREAAMLEKTSKRKEGIKKKGKNRKEQNSAQSLESRRERGGERTHTQRNKNMRNDGTNNALRIEKTQGKKIIIIKYTNTTHTEKQRGGEIK